MSKQYKPVTDAEFNAYIDGELDESDILRVEAFLADNAEAAERFRHNRLVNDGLHRLFDPVLCESVPEKIYQSVTQKDKYVKAHHFMKVAVMAGIMMFSGVGGWLLNAYNNTESTPVIAHLVSPATFAHVVYSTDPHYPVEFSANDQSKLSDWLSDRMHTTICAPLLTDIGFELVGGRLLPSTNRMAAQYMYQNSELERITLYIRRNAWDKKTSPFTYAEDNGVRAFYWYTGIMGFVVTGEISKEKLINVAQNIHNSFNNNGITF